MLKQKIKYFFTTSAAQRRFDILAQRNFVRDRVETYWRDIYTKSR